MKKKQTKKKSRSKRQFQLKDLRKGAVVIDAIQKIPQSHQPTLFSHLNDETLLFLTKCVSCILNGDPHFHLSKAEKAEVAHCLKPHQKILEYIATPKNQKLILRKIKKPQLGEGFLISALLSAATPLISSLIQNAISKYKKKT